MLLVFYLLVCLSPIVVIFGQVFPSSSLIPNVEVGTATMCSVALDCGLMNNILSPTAQIQKSFSFQTPFTTTPNVFVSPIALTNGQLTETSFECFVDLPSVTTTEFTVKVKRYAIAAFSLIRLQYMASTNGNIKYQTITLSSQGPNSYYSDHTFINVYDQPPFVAAFLTRFEYTNYYSYSINEITNSGLRIQMGSNDFSGQLTFQLVIINKGEIQTTKTYLGVEQTLKNITPIQLSTDIVQNGLSYCINSASTQLLYGLTVLKQPSYNQQAFKLSATAFNSVACEWNAQFYSIQYSQISLVTIQLVSLSLLKCSTILPEYFSNGMCEKCHYSCLSCDSSGVSDCLTCNLSDTRNFESGQCKCQDQYYDDGVSASCKQCDPTCQTCNGAQNSDCQSCFANQYREIDGSTCKCMSQYEHTGNSICSKIVCSYSCNSCFGGATNQCLNCSSQPLDYRQQFENSCTCLDGYYDDGINMQCQKCDSTCLTCNAQGPLSCLSCEAPLEFSEGSCVDVATTTSASTQPLEPSIDSSTLPYITQESSTPSTNPTNSTSSDSQPSTPTSSSTTSDSSEATSTPNKLCLNGALVDDICYPCHTICATCYGPFVNQCLTCKSKLLDDVVFNLNGQSIFNHKQSIRIEASYIRYACDQGEVKEITKTSEALFYQWIITNSKEISIQETAKRSIQSQAIELLIPPKTLLPNQHYNLALQFSTKTMLITTKSQKISTLPANWKIFFVGGNQRWGIEQTNNITVQIADMTNDHELVTDFDTYSMTWSCSSCKDRLNNPIVLNQTSQVQTFAPKTFTPYQTYTFTVEVVEATSQERQSTECVVYVYEAGLPVLNIDVDPRYRTFGINIQEELNILYRYEGNDDPDLLFYSANLYYDFEIVSTIVYKYSEIKFTIWDHHSEFQKGSELYFMASVFNPKYFMPSFSTLRLSVNIPPQGCRLVINKLKVKPVTELVTAHVVDCLDQGQNNLLYSFGYYLHKQDQQQDLVESEDLHLIEITDRQNIEIAQFYLPYSHSSIVVMAQVQNEIGAVTNLTKTIAITSVDLQQYKSAITTNYHKAPTNQKLNILYALLFTVENRQEAWLNYTSFISSAIMDLISEGFDAFSKRQLDGVQVLYYGMENTLSLSTKEHLEFTQSKVSSVLGNKLAIINLKKAEKNNLQIQGHLQKLNTQLAQYFNLIGRTIHFNHIFSLLQNNSQELKIFDKYADFMLQIELNTFYDMMDTIPNQGEYKIEGTYFNSMQSLLTHKPINTLLSENKVGRLLEKENELVNVSSEYYMYHKVDYTTNPYTANKSFPYQESNFSLSQLTIKKTEPKVADPKVLGQLQNIKPTAPLTYNITAGQKKDSDRSNLVCIQQQLDHSWKSEECRMDTSSKGKIICSCNRISLTTVVSDSLNKFQQEDVFTSEGLSAINDFEWYKSILFYIMCTLTVLYLGLMVWGIRKDQNDQQERLEVKTLAGSPDAKLDDYLQKRTLDGRSQRSRAYNLNQPRSQQTFFQFSSAQVLPIPEDVIQEQNEVDIQIDGGKRTICGSLQAISIPKVLISNPVKKIGYQKYLIANHPLLSIISFYDTLLSRPLRATLVYLTVIQTLAVILIFGNDLQAARTVILMSITSIASGLTLLILKKLLGHNSLYVNIVGGIFSLCFAGFSLYIILAVTALTKTIEQTNIWAIQYSLSFAADFLFLAPLRSLLKCRIANYLIINKDHGCAQIVQKMLFTVKELDIIQQLVD